MQNMKTKRADKLQPGDWLAFKNPRFNSRVVSIELDSIGGIRVRHDGGNGGEPASSCYQRGDLVAVV